jgi:hypothetical protein
MNDTLEKKMILVGPQSTAFANLVPQLNALQKYGIVQTEKSFGSLLDLSDFEGWIVLSCSENDKVESSLVIQLRDRNPQACLLAVVPPTMSLELMRTLVQAEVDETIVSLDSFIEFQTKLTAAREIRNFALKENTAGPANPVFDSRVDVIASNCQRIMMSGWISERCVLPVVQAQGPDSVLFIECNQLRGINSVGIRLWLVWMTNLKASGFSHIEFVNLHPGFLQLASFIKSFLPANATIGSFYLHYWCDEKNLRKEFRFISGEHFTADELRITKVREVPEEGVVNKYVMDDAIPLILKFFPGSIQYL